MSLAVSTLPLRARSDAEVRRPASGTIRIPELDGLRGLMTLFVVVSHYFGEVPSGIGPLCVGWVAVNVFFVLSGYLVGRLIIEKRSAGNFLPVFYLRRVCRTFPTYMLCCAAVLVGLACLGGVPWTQSDDAFPSWSYFVFVQNVFFVTRQAIGVHWLAPTWTLALEEQFYLVAPLVFLLLPQRGWAPAFLAVIAAGFAARAYGVTHGLVGFAPLALLPTSADVLSMGLLLAVVRHGRLIPWERWSGALRVAPIVCLVATFGIQRLDVVPGGAWFQIFGPLLISTAAALFILMLVENAPEAARFRSPVLRFFGDISYGVYLTHLAVLGLVHGLLFHAEPQLGSWNAVLATFVAIPITVALAWLVTAAVERPMTAWGRSFRWR